MFCHGLRSTINLYNLPFPKGKAKANLDIDDQEADEYLSSTTNGLDITVSSLCLSGIVISRIEKNPLFAFGYFDPEIPLILHNRSH